MIDIVEKFIFGIIYVLSFLVVAIVVGVLMFLFVSILGSGTISWQTLQEFFLGPLYFLNILEHRYDPAINRNEYAAFFGTIYWVVLIYGLITGFEE